MRPERCSFHAVSRNIENAAGRQVERDLGFPVSSSVREIREADQPVGAKR